MARAARRGVTEVALSPGAAAGLDALDRLARAAPAESWFAAVGEPLTPAEADEARLYLTGLGFAAATVEPVADWAEARRRTQAADWEPRWWAAEEAERARLLALAEAAVPERALYAALSRVAQSVGDAVHGMAAVAAARGGVADAALIRAAAGAAAMACHHWSLAQLAGTGAEHPFAAKYRLFAAGRWPLAISVGGLYSVF